MNSKPKKKNLNPVALAYMKQKLKSAITTHRVSIFLLNEDENCNSNLTATSLPVFVMIYCLEKLGLEDSVDYRKLKSAVNVLLECSANEFKWKKRYAITIDNALEIYVRRAPSIDPALMSQAIQHLSE